jgi:hypothetical protein
MIVKGHSSPENESATLVTLEKAALAAGKRLQIALVQP